MARHNEFRRPQDAHVKMPETPAAAADDALFGGDAQPEAQIDAIEMPPAPVDVLKERDYPYDGQPVLVMDGEGNKAEAIWRVTREWGGSASRWVSTGFWIARNSGGSKLHFTPTHYRKIES